MKKQFSLILLFLFLIPSIPTLQSCEKLGTGLSMNFITSLDKEKTKDVSAQSNFDFVSCDDHADEYLVFTSSPVYTDMLQNSTSIPDGTLPKRKCSIENSPLSISNPAEANIAPFYMAQKKYLEQCLNLEITNLRGEIDYIPTTEENCRVTSLTKDKVIAKGVRCIVKIHDNDQFRVRYTLEPSCATKEFMKNNPLITPMDIKGLLTVMTAVTLDPGSPSYEVVALIDLGVRLQPTKDLFPVSKYLGDDFSIYPVTYGTEVAFGNVELSQSTKPTDKKFIIKAPFLINNNCPQVCSDGFCSGPCNYYVPVAATLTLKRKRETDSTFKHVDMWYQGGRITPRFLGKFTFGRTIKNNEIKVGDQFILEAEFSSPSIIYRTLKNETNKFLITLRDNSLFGPNGVAPHIREIAELEGFMPEELGLGIPEIGAESEDGLIQQDPKKMMDDILKMFSNITNLDDSWPPYYDQVCFKSNCDQAKTRYLTLKVGFKVKSVSPSSGVVKLERLATFRNSKIYGDEAKELKTFPDVKCK